MSYIGVEPSDTYSSLAVQHFTTSATASYTLDQSVTSETDIRLYINNVAQQPGSSYAYTCSGTNLTLSTAITSADTMYCVFVGKSIGTISPPDGSVGASQLTTNAVGNSAMADDAIGLAELSATGTASSSTFLRGDNSWASPVHTGNVAFPATQVASADANTLDDYEEGTWTPTNTSSSGFTAGVTSYYGSTPSYTKIGRKVTIYGGLFFGNSSGTIATGDWIDIGGLPFSNNIRGSGGAKFIYNYANWANVTVSMVGSQLLMQMATVSGSPNRVDSALVLSVTYDV